MASRLRSITLAACTLGAMAAAAHASCPPDLAEPFGTLDGADAAELVMRVDAADPSGDWDGSGATDFFDVLAYLRDFDEGCGCPPVQVPELTLLPLRPGGLVPAIRTAFVSDDASTIAAKHETISGVGGTIWYREADTWIRDPTLNISRPVGVSADGRVVASELGSYWVKNEPDRSVQQSTNPQVFGVSPDGTRLYGMQIPVAPTFWMVDTGLPTQLPGPNILNWAVCSSDDNSRIYGAGRVPTDALLIWEDGTLITAEPFNLDIKECNRSGQVATGRGSVPGVGFAPIRIDGSTVSTLAEIQGDGVFQSRSYALTESGDIFVGIGFDAPTGKDNQIPLIWAEGGSAVQRLDAYLTALGTDLTGIGLQTATDISPDGRFIAAGGTFNGTSGAILIDLAPCQTNEPQEINVRAELGVGLSYPRGTP